METTIEYGVSDISIMQIGRSANDTRKDAKRVGYDGFQALPLKNGITGLEEDTICYEDVWRPELQHFWQIDASRAFDDILQLFLLFKKEKAAQMVVDNHTRRRITHISHEFIDLVQDEYENTLVEISPNLSVVSLEVLKDACESRQILVADTRHLIDYEKLEQVKAEDVVYELRRNFAPVIHFQPVIDIDEFIRKTTNIDSVHENYDWASLREIQIFRHLLQIMKINFEEGIYGESKLTIIIEYNPKFNFLSRRKSILLASNMLHRTKALVYRYFES